MNYGLTEGAIQALVNGEEPQRPVLQCLGSKELSSSGPKRIRLLLSDGVHSFGTSMLSTQLNHLVTDGQLQQFAVICLNRYQATVLQGTKRVVICLEIEIIHTAAEVGQRIGDPVPLNQTNQAGGGQQQRATVSAPAAAPAPLQSHNRLPPPQPMQSPRPTGKTPFGGGGAPTTPGGSATKVVPIGSLTPYQNRWTIRARVLNKATIKEWKNARGEGKLFNFTVMDDSGDIRITCFNEEATKFYDVIEAGKVFYISNASLKPANQQYNNTKHDYEMTLRKDSTVVVCDTGDSNLVPSVVYDFVPIKDLASKVNKFIDVIGVVKSAEELQTIMIRSQNRETSIRKFSLVDQSNSMIRVTLWGKDAETFDATGNPVIAFKSAKISDFGGCSMSTTSMTTMTVNPDVPEAYDLKQWYTSGGNTQATESLTTMDAGSAGGGSANWKTLAEIKDEHLGFGDKPDYVTSKVTILYCKKENTLYQACTSEGCNKKVIDLSNGQYRCEKCNSTTDRFNYRLILNMHVSDEFDNQWVTVFQDQGEILLGLSAQELGALKESDDIKYEAALRKVDFQSYFMKFRVKSERYNDEERIRVTAVNVSPISFTEYNTKLMQDIEKLRAA